MICAGASELAMAQWASTFAQNALGIDKTLGDLLGPCMFALFMGIVRVMYGLMENKLNFRKFSIFSCVLCGGFYLAAALSKNPFIALAGCSFCGFAISTLWPGTVEVAAKKFPDAIPQELKDKRLGEIMALQEEIALETNQEKIGKTLNVVIDREEEDYFVGRTEWDSPEVDPEVLVKKSRRLDIGEFYQVTITDALPFELIGEVADV
jgi:hypothetical protein